MKKNAHKLDVDRNRLRKMVQHAISPAFLLILLGSFILWYTSKLSYEYTTQMPLNVRIDGQKYRLTAVVNGRGTTLIAQKLSLNSKINLKMEELGSRQAGDDPNAYEFSKGRLLSAINNTVKDLKVTEVVDAPEFTPEPPKETRKGRRERRRLELEDELRQAPEPTE